MHQVFETGLVKGDQNHVLFWYYMNVAVRTGGRQDCYVYSIPILLVLPDMEPCLLGKALMVCGNSSL